MSSIFSKIVKGEIPSYKIAETEDYFAFLDIFPVTRGHVLVIPKQEVNRLFDLEEEAYMGLMAFSRKIAKAMKKVFPCDRIGMSVIGLEVPHAHVHLMPINVLRDMDFTKPKLKLTKEEFEEIVAKIQAEL